MALISVIMPAYKVEQYLEQCLQSVVDQDLKDIEIIPIDNGSPDKCGDIIREFAKNDKRIKPIFIKDNKGYAGAVNAGLEVATGKYIAIVETDDYVEPDMLSSLYDAAERHGAKIAKGGFTKHFPDGNTLYCRPSCTFYQHEVIVEPLCNNDILYMESSIWTAIYDREFLLENGIKMQTFSGAAYQDVIFKFMAYTVVDFLVCIDKPVYNYRVFSANSSSKSTQFWDRHFQNYNVIKEWLVEKGVYEAYRHAYYISMCADFIFHHNRLVDEPREMFCEKAAEVCREALEEGVDIFHPRFGDKQFERYYYVEVIPLLEKITGEKNTQIFVEQAGAAGGRGYRELIKRALRALNRLKIFNKLTNAVISVLRRPFFLSKIVVGGGPAPLPMTGLCSMNTTNGRIELDSPSEKKKILVILPWYDKNAVNVNIDILATAFKEQDYETHLLVYWNAFAPNILNKDAWDRVFWKHADNWYFGRNDATKAAVDGNRVDDWIADDFLESVIRLNNHYKYDICMANYLFFTSAFKVLPASVKKVLYTHDRFAKRNSSLQDAGFSSQSFWFSVATEEEEACALKRADIVLAIQEEDGNYFRRITGNDVEVMVVPFIPEADFVNYKDLRGKEVLEVGYLASSNPPNVASIKKVISLIEKGGKIRLHIAGSVTYALEGSLYHQNVINEGTVDSVKEFYSKCDVMINPDTFYSGLKVKTAEAMSYGTALVCTDVASTGLPLDKDYHHLENEEACVDYLKDLAAMNYNSRRVRVKEMRTESRKKYTAYRDKYPLEELIKTICE